MILFFRMQMGAGMGDLTGVLVAAGLVAGFGLLASVPMIAVTMRQNSARRHYTREVAERFALDADMDSGARFRRARPMARGTVGKQLVDVRTGISRSSYLKASGRGFHRTDLCLVTVFARRRLEPFTIRASLISPQAGDFDSSFTIEAVESTPDPGCDLKLRLLSIRRDFFRSFEIAVYEDGRIESATAPLLSRKNASGVIELVDTMLLMGEVL